VFGYQENYGLKKKNQDFDLAPEKITEIFYVPNNSKKKKKVFCCNFYDFMKRSHRLVAENFVEMKLKVLKV
jgi:hypothetical protein